MKKAIIISLLLSMVIFSSCEKKSDGNNDYTTNYMFDSRDGQEYDILKIGDQWWMVENLAYLPEVSRSSSESYTEPYYYVSGYQGTSVSEAKATGNYETYGVLYNWPATMAGATSSDANPSGVQGICPDGWHLPSDAEWKELEMYLGMSQSEADVEGWRGTDEGSKLKSTSGWNNNGNGTNESGFTALPGSLRSSSGTFYSVGGYGYWWSATESTSGWALYRELSYRDADVQRLNLPKEYGFSVRCVRD